MDSSSICLVVIYNHNYEKNIPRIRRIYAKRFAHVFHVIPFYRGEDPDVIGVYESAFQFSGYIAQAFPRIKDARYSHYVFVADDICLLPSISDKNIISALRLDKLTGFISVLDPVDLDCLLKWPFGMSTYMHFLSGGNACECSRFLPTREEAVAHLERHGIDCRFAVSEQQFRILRRLLLPHCDNPYAFFWMPILGRVAHFVRFLPNTPAVYPMVHGFSDFVAVPSAAIDTFAHYCGVFAATRVFVEAAIPMALLFSCEKVVTLKDIGLTGITGNGGNADRAACLKRYALDYSELCRNFPAAHLYVHPVKLSQWTNLP